MDADVKWSRAREVMLAQRIEAGDTQARLTFIEENMPLARDCVKRLMPKHEGYRSRDLEADLMGDACEALIKAVDRFDHRPGTKFSTYARPWIRGALMRRFTEDAKQPRPSAYVTSDI